VGRVVHFEIHASDMDRAERFYTEVFGWTAQRAQSGERDYRLLVTGPDTTPGINGALIERWGGDPAPGDAVTGFACTIAVEDLDDTRRQIAERGGRQVMEVREVPGVGRLAYFRDPEGNLLGAIQPER
jgi:predicted enzyme related to lactoylglutathione lyase